MRNSKTLARIRNNETVRICGLGHFIPAFIKQAAHNNYDCIWLDMEHRLFSPHEVQMLLAFSHLFDIDIMLRSPTRERNQLYRYLEDGAAGLMIPHVNTPEVARALVDATKFPPVGDRGLDGAGLDCDFYVDLDVDAYTAHANRETFLVVQIETPQAVDNIDEIVSIEGLDGIFIGPGDLGLRLRLNPDGMQLEEAIEKIADSCARHGKAWGCPAATEEVIKKRQSQGGQLLAHGGEFGAFMEKLQECSRHF